MGSGINVFPATSDGSSPVPDYLMHDRNLYSGSTNSIASTEPYGRDSSTDVDQPDCSRMKNTNVELETDAKANPLVEDSSHPNIDSLTVNFSVAKDVENMSQNIGMELPSSTIDPLGNFSVKNNLTEPPEKLRNKSKSNVASKFAVQKRDPSEDGASNKNPRKKIEIPILEKSCEKRRKHFGADGDVVAVQGTQPENETAIDVIFSWCDSPHAIYVRTVDMQDGFRELREQMQKYYTNVELPNVRNFEVGFRCAVFTDLTWWRAEVTCLDNYPECEVRLVDTGYLRHVNAQEIRPLTPEFDSYRRLTMKCSLEGVYPPPSGIWEEATISL